MYNPNLIQTSNGQKYASHWHVRLNQPTEEGINKIITILKTLLSDGFFEYVVVAKSNDQTISHVHMALGTARSIKKTTLGKKLGFVSRDKIKAVCHQYHIDPVYSTSSPLKNANYVRGHQVILDEGKEITNTPMELIEWNF